MLQEKQSIHRDQKSEQYQSDRPYLKTKKRWNNASDLRTMVSNLEFYCQINQQQQQEEEEEDMQGLKTFTMLLSKGSDWRICPTKSRK